MVHWPKSILGNVATIAIALIAGLALIQSAIALSGSFVWISLAVAALVVVVAVVVYRRVQAASDLALADAPSFADVLPQWNSRKGLEAARLGRPVERSGSTPPSSAEKAGDTGVDAVAPGSPRSSEDEAQNSGPVSVNRPASPAATKNPHSASEAPSSAMFR